MKHAHCGLVILSLILGGCAAIPGFGPPPVDAYDLSAPLLQPVSARRARTQILVPEPAALKLLDGQDVAIRTASGALQLLGGARWSDRLPKLVQSRLVEAFQRTDRLAGVGRPGEGLAIDYQVIVDIRAFEVRVGSDQAHVELFVKVLDDRSGQVRASRDFVTSAPVTGTGDEAFIAALDQAFNAAVADIVAWSLDVI
ncbi:ABC-type transport auxiliary lipoprotein family protein [Chelativorans sp. AA-79]|uniref:ABC-type transport auxiliary lipoprotein family protein n=1 Tax=Chelativorans sp. AA-79 TaxID=3028735 RepID=UPI0023F93130|nr:ABC-type transport auxiliary lipoprotein family protein [Chelativorans sp. AA-79]WEX11588.1 ABC-type transport auxiliary lipoprotein family protein [Chelativorans sp. AA-79]